MKLMKLRELCLNICVLILSLLSHCLINFVCTFYLLLFSRESLFYFYQVVA